MLRLFSLIFILFLSTIISAPIRLEINHDGDQRLFEVLFQKSQQTPSARSRNNSPQSSTTSHHRKRSSSLLENLQKHSLSEKQQSQLASDGKPSTTPAPPDHGNFTDFSLYTSFGNAYMVDLYAGSENNEFKVMLDTGSSYTWLTAVNCTSCESIGIKKHYICDKSTTCANQTQHVDVVYGKGVVKATVFRDQLGFNHDTLIAKNQDFLLATTIDDLTYFPGQGLLGLGFDALSDGRKTIFDNLKEQGSIHKRQFAFSLSGDSENVEFGQTDKDYFIIGGDGVDPHLADDTDSFVCGVSYKPYWSVNVTSIIPIISDVEMNIGLQTQIAIIDSGTSFIVFNEEDFEILRKFIAKLSKLKCEVDTEYHLLKCQELAKDVYPILKFTLCSQSRPILLYPQQYLLCDITACYIRIASISFGIFSKRIVILGDIFLRTQYILFDQDDMNISFYQKKTPTAHTTPQESNTQKELGNFNRYLQTIQESDYFV